MPFAPLNYFYISLLQRWTTYLLFGHACHSMRVTVRTIFRNWFSPLPGGLWEIQCIKYLYSLSHPTGPSIYLFYIYLSSKLLETVLLCCSNLGWLLTTEPRFKHWSNFPASANWVLGSKACATTLHLTMTTKIPCRKVRLENFHLVFFIFSSKQSSFMRLSLFSGLGIKLLYMISIC